MEILQQHVVDAGEQAANGLYDYYYAFTIYRFISDDVEVQFRIYDDKTNATFLGRPSPSTRRLLAEAVAYLRTERDITTVSVYDGTVGHYVKRPVGELEEAEQVAAADTRKDARG